MQIASNFQQHFNKTGDCIICVRTQRLLTFPVTAFFGAALLVVFFLLPEEKFLANQSEMSGKSLDWLNIFIDDCIS